MYLFNSLVYSTKDTKYEDNVGYKFPQEALIFYCTVL